MDYSGYELNLVEVSEGIATVTMNRPEMRNAATIELHKELEDIWFKIARDETISAVILTGAGKAFSAGGDIKNMADRANTPAGLRHSLRAPGHTRRLWESMLMVEQPIIGAINGDAMGLGCNLALFCDITVMAETARIGDTHTRLGLVAGDGGAVMFPLLLGIGKAKDFLLRARVVDGVEAQRIGLVNHVAPAEEVLAEARAIAAEISRLPTWSVRWTKLALNKALREQFNLSFDVSMAYEMLTMQTQDFGEATRAFVEKRKPQFSNE